MLRRKRFLVGIAVVLVAMGYLMYAGFSGASTYYYEVGEVLAKGSAAYDESFRVSGKVADGSIEQEAGGLDLKFTLIDEEGKNSIPVIYTGVVPDTFQQDSDVVAEGRLTSDGVFEASLILAKCPSKYVPE